jgi:alpha-1,6-mannosyltransferase
VLFLVFFCRKSYPLNPFSMALRDWALPGVYLAALGAMVAWVDRVPGRVFEGGVPAFVWFLLLMLLLHGAWYRWTVATPFRGGWMSLLVVAALVRLPLFFGPPNLSDDFYRYLWDGRLALHGTSPFAHRPSELVGDAAVRTEAPLPVLDDLYGRFNSPDFYTLYPPTAQAAFVSAAAWGGGTAEGEAQVLRGWILLAELVSIVLLWKLLEGMGLPPARAAWYGLHPLAVVELTGNLHVEAFAVVFLLGAFWLLQRGRWAWAALAWAGAIGAKLSPLWFLPLVWPLLGLRRWMVFGLLCGAACLLSFLPLWCPDFLPHITETTGRYYRQFSFNSPVESLLRWSTTLLLGYSLGVVLMPVAGLLALWFPWMAVAHRPGPDLRRAGELLCVGYTWYVLFSGMAHPWYLCLPLAFAPFCRPRFLWAWAALSALSYHAYLGADYAESPGWLWCEYGGALALAWWGGRSGRRTALAE